MSRFFQLAILLIGFKLNAVAADPAFIVFYNSGKAVKIVNGKDFLLKKGDHLQLEDQVSIPDKTSLVLVCANFAVVQLKTKGARTVKSLLASCSNKSASASSSYFKYVWNSFSHAHVAPESDPRKFMKTYGAASRGSGIPLLNVDTINYYAGNLQIKWLPAKDVIADFYKVPVGGNPVLTAKNAVGLQIDSVAGKLKPGNYYWEIVGDQAPKRKYLKIWNKDAYRASVAKILSGVVATSPAEKAYLTGYILEENHCLAEAYHYYKKALALDPTNQSYLSAVTRF